MAYIAEKDQIINVDLFKGNEKNEKNEENEESDIYDLVLQLQRSDHFSSISDYTRALQTILTHPDCIKNIGFIDKKLYKIKLEIFKNSKTWTYHGNL